MLRYTCPYCEKHVLIADEERDQQVKCPHCEMLGVAYGVNVKSTDAPDVPAGHSAERHHPAPPRPEPEPHPSVPPPIPPAVSEVLFDAAPPPPPPPPGPPAFGGGSGEGAPDLEAERLLRARVRQTLSEQTSEQAAEQAQHMGLLSTISGAVGCLMGLTTGASPCFILLPLLCAVLAFVLATKADRLGMQETSSGRPASGVKLAVVGRFLGGAAIILGLAMLTTGC